MLELGNSFPSGEMVEKLAKVLDIQAFQLFNPTATTEGALLHLEQAIVENIEKVVRTSIKQDIVSEINQTVSRAIKQASSEERKTKRKR